MALTVVRPCVVCNAPMKTQRSTKQTCSERCTKSLYRAQQRAQRATPTEATQPIKPKEATPMSTSQLFQPDPQHLKRLQDFEIQHYREDVQCNVEGKQRLGMMECFEIHGLQAALDKYTSLLALGYTATDNVAHAPQIATDYVVLHLKKPAAQIEQDEAGIRASVEASYLETLSALKAEAVKKEVESLLASERRKREQAEVDTKEAAEAAEYARVESEVLAALGGTHD